MLFFSFFFFSNIRLERNIQPVFYKPFCASLSLWCLVSTFQFIGRLNLTYAASRPIDFKSREICCETDTKFMKIKNYGAGLLHRASIFMKSKRVLEDPSAEESKFFLTEIVFFCSSFLCTIFCCIDSNSCFIWYPSKFYYAATLLIILKVTTDFMLLS